MGQLADFTLPQNDNKRLAGIGEKAVELIEEATTKFYASYKPPEAAEAAVDAEVTDEDEQGIGEPDPLDEEDDDDDDE